MCAAAAASLVTKLSARLASTAAQDRLWPRTVRPVRMPMCQAYRSAKPARNASTAPWPRLRRSHVPRVTGAVSTPRRPSRTPVLPAVLAPLAAWHLRPSAVLAAVDSGAAAPASLLPLPTAAQGTTARLAHPSLHPAMVPRATCVHSVPIATLALRRLPHALPALSPTQLVR